MEEFLNKKIRSCMKHGFLPREGKTDPIFLAEFFLVENLLMFFVRCHHNKHGKCLHCIPVEPYDEEYLKNHSPPIKHMSFQAYIRQLRNLSSGDR